MTSIYSLSLAILKEPKDNIDVDLWTKIAKFLVTFGVYALFVIFLFYLERRAYHHLITAKQGDPERRFFLKIYSLVLTCVIVLAAIVTIIWIYSTFFFRPLATVEGTLTGVRQGGIRPAAAGSSSIALRVASPYGTGRFYMREKGSDQKAGDNDLLWALVTPSDEHVVLFSFEQSCEFIPRDVTPAAVNTPSKTDQTNQAQTATPLSMSLRLDFGAPSPLSAKKVDLRYTIDNNDPCGSRGTIYRLEDGSWHKLRWEPETAITPPPPTTSRSSLFETEAFAAEPQARRSTPTLTDELAHRLPENLASEDLGTQLEARQVLIANGASSFAFIERTLAAAKGWTGREHLRLIQSLATVVEDIEKSGTATPVSLQLALARALYDIRDYKRCVARFQRITSAAIEQQPELLIVRGAAELRIDKYEAALASFEAYNTRATTPHDKSMALGDIAGVWLTKGDNGRARKAATEALRLDPKNDGARENLAIVESRDQHYDAAAAAYRELLRADPKSISLRVNLAVVDLARRNTDEAIDLLEQAHALAPDDFIVLNDLASAYADKGIHLDLALRYASQALDDRPEDPLYLDTRGWVEFKLGRPNKALPFLEKAHAKSPGDKDIADHVAKARQALGRATGAPPSSP
jgi:tetratricopeptide (TPR) repeat protein